MSLVRNGHAAASRRPTPLLAPHQRAGVATATPKPPPPDPAPRATPARWGRSIRFQATKGDVPGSQRPRRSLPPPDPTPRATPARWGRNGHTTAIPARPRSSRHTSALGSERPHHSPPPPDLPARATPARQGRNGHNRLWRGEGGGRRGVGRGGGGGGGGWGGGKAGLRILNTWATFCLRRHAARRPGDQLLPAGNQKWYALPSVLAGRRKLGRRARAKFPRFLFLPWLCGRTLFYTELLQICKGGAEEGASGLGGSGGHTARRLGLPSPGVSHPLSLHFFKVKLAGAGTSPALRAPRRRSSSSLRNTTSAVTSPRSAFPAKNLTRF